MAKKTDKKIDGDVLTIKFIESGETLSIDINSIPAEYISKLAMHGLSQKVGDSYAGADASESFARADAVIKDLQAGNWSTRVAAGSPRSTQLAQAVVAATGKTMEEIVAKLETMDDGAKKAIRAHAQIKVALAQIKADKAAADAIKAAENSSESAPLIFD